MSERTVNFAFLAFSGPMCCQCWDGLHPRRFRRGLLQGAEMSSYKAGEGSFGAENLGKTISLGSVGFAWFPDLRRTHPSHRSPCGPRYLHCTDRETDA